MALGSCVVFAAALAQAAPANSPATLPIVAPVVSCESLTTADLSSAVGAPTHITAAVKVSDAKPAAYCRVSGYVEPAIKFEVRLPLATWTQRYVQSGCGGLCGSLTMGVGAADGCGITARGEIALASTDMGHTGGMEGDFGDTPQLRVDFAYRSLHVTALAAKALIARFYGQAPKYSYFSGCSDGGREALIEAQRFPQDFDGITAGAAAMNFTTQNTFNHGWNTVANTGADGKPILTTAKLPILHQAALATCDAADGLKDGLISDPIHCHFDPAVTQCKPGQATNSCLTAAEVAVARALYAGANDGHGHKLVINGLLPGSELAWAGVVVPAPSQPHAMGYDAASGVLKHLVYTPNPPADYELRKDLKFTAASFATTTKLHGLYDATDPNLQPFAARGGKLILWHGLADPHISPLNSIAYYEAVERTLGKKQTQKAVRLYLFPGGYHCGGGEGPMSIDLLSAVMAWVERGQAPFAILAKHTTGGPRGPMAGGPHKAGKPDGAPHDLPPMNAGKVDRTRPVYPYPLTAKYKGTGSIDDAANFTVGAANSVPATRLNWLGSQFYTPGHELWCTPDASHLNCKTR